MNSTPADRITLIREKAHIELNVIEHALVRILRFSDRQLLFNSITDWMNVSEAGPHHVLILNHRLKDFDIFLTRRMQITDYDSQQSERHMICLQDLRLDRSFFKHRGWI